VNERAVRALVSQEKTVAAALDAGVVARGEHVCDNNVIAMSAANAEHGPSTIDLNRRAPERRREPDTHSGLVATRIAH
jgi:hypothetical protein